MSLVAYDSSDDEKDEEIIISEPSHFIKPKTETILPAKRQKECVKITIPALKEFEEEESPVAVKKQKFQPGSGLFSLLPPPKNSQILKKPGFVPYVLSSKKSNKEVSHSVSPKCTSEPSQTESFNSVLDEENDDETSCNEESTKAHSGSCEDFFSLKGLSSDNHLDDKSSLPIDHNLDNDPLSIPGTSASIQDSSSSILSSNNAQKVNELVDDLYVKPSQLNQEEIPNSEQVALVQSEQLNSSINPCIDHTNDSNYTEPLLSDNEFLKLKGRRREFEAINIIDVNADDQLTDRNEWLMKSLTEESTHRPSRKKHNMPTQQQKRKHQITYLAFQAKEREMDLKNQWALNSRTRRETQAKYGF